MNILEKAIIFATEKHQGQVDKDGSLHILHSLGVMFSAKQLANQYPKGFTLSLDELMAAAVIHDVIEDTPVTLKEVTQEFGQEIAYTVDCLSRRDAPEGKETYRDFIYRTISNPNSKLIKRADLSHNLGRSHEIKEEKWRKKLQYKYGTAIKVIDYNLTWEQASTEWIDGVKYVSDPNGKKN